MTEPDLIDATDLSALRLSQAPRRATVAFMLEHPAHWLALGAGSGLSPKAPGTVGTLWAWASFTVLQHLWGTGTWANACWAWLIGAGTVVGVWACTRAARALRVADPSAVVWDEIVAFWLVLWLITPCSFVVQCLAFALFRYFDAVKPGPVAWADQYFKSVPGQPIGWRQGAGILLDDFVAAGCTLLVIAFAAPWWRGW